eukprot:gb/GEZN01015115.1/.p1 GENE.gb/GEZN01015115.1/~~gb/GEZN01015115.1/.p1  ORF type:complete len:241 (-),score=28.62 gb/GEZN01015115.1/:153-875(-)
MTSHCTFWLQGNCRKAKDCAFLHDMKMKGTSPDPNFQPGMKGISPQKNIPCDFHANGKCLKGEMCSFLHAKKQEVQGKKQEVQRKHPEKYVKPTREDKKLAAPKKFVGQVHVHTSKLSSSAVVLNTVAVGDFVFRVEVHPNKPAAGFFFEGEAKPHDIYFRLDKNASQTKLQRKNKKLGVGWHVTVCLSVGCSFFNLSSPFMFTEEAQAFGWKHQIKKDMCLDSPLVLNFSIEIDKVILG